MIPQIIINKFKKGMIVVHPSLLPKYRGGSPIFHAIANGEEKSGVSYIEIAPGKFDSGNLLLQK
jgi:methionyl-tRNA formyltransferase